MLSKSNLILFSKLGLLACAQDVWRADAPDFVAVEGLTTPQAVAFNPADDLSPSVASNGRWLAFVSQQNGNLDVWVRDFGGNSTYPLTLHPADDFDPAISPDDRTLVFVSRRSDAKGDLWLAEGFEAGAPVRPLTDHHSQDRQPVFSPSGEQIYFTSAVGIGLEHIAELTLSTGQTRRLSPTPGFDPAVAPDGRYLVYTAPAGEARRPAPHLVALRLSDGSTRALSRGDAPEGFARFVPRRYVKGSDSLVFIRFPDDDDGSGQLDADDQASLWRMNLDLDALFAGGAPSAPWPLTDGSEDELFPAVGDGLLYFTQGTRQQDIMRLPLGGQFPEYEDPADYLRLASTLPSLRTRWFAFRSAAARAAPDALVTAQAWWSIARLQLERERPDLARQAFESLILATDSFLPPDPRATLGGLAQVEILELDRQDAWARAATPAARERVAADMQQRLDRLAPQYLEVSAVQARLELARAELQLARGDRAGAILRLDRLAARSDELNAAARAMVRRIELLGIAHDAPALGAAYSQVLARFPSEREVVREATRRIIRTWTSDLVAKDDWRAEVDLLRRLVTRAPASPVRLAARRQLASVLRSRGALGDAALELAQLVEEEAGDRLGVARALQELAEVDEARSLHEASLGSWRKLRASFSDLPGVGASARDAITRLNIRLASELEAKGELESARRAYREVIENDLVQVNAHRRYLALSAATGTLESALQEAEARAEGSRRTPVARYAYGLALTYAAPVDFDAAQAEIEAALELNPQLVHAYLTRGWIQEMRGAAQPSTWQAFLNGLAEFAARAVSGMVGSADVEERGAFQAALEDYRSALRLNQESIDSETEAEALLNLGNAHYQIAVKTNDVTNMRFAFERYVEMLRIGYSFRSAETELVFWERCGRAAWWADDPVTSVMATRRAIELADRAERRERLPQLWGNLALAYDQGGEDAYARAALEQLKTLVGELGGKAQIQGEILALRNRARAKLETLGVRTNSALEGALDDLALARRQLQTLGEIDRGDRPTKLLPVEPNGTRAQYGFDSTSELDLNLALASVAHRALAEPSRVDALEESRRGLSEKVLEAREADQWGWMVTREGVTLTDLYERVGLEMAAGRRRAEAGDWPAAATFFERAESVIDGLGGELGLDQLSVEVVRADVVAAQAELWAAHGEASEPAISGWQARLDQAGSRLVDAFAKAAQKTKTPSALEVAAQSFTSSVAIIGTATIAVAGPTAAGDDQTGRAVRARLLHARALISVRAAAVTARRGGNLAALLSGLDQARAHLEAAAKTYEAAASVAAAAGPGLGARVLALSFAGWAESSARLGVQDPRLDVAWQRAERVARHNGDVGLAAVFGLTRLLRNSNFEGLEARLEATPTVLLARYQPLVDRVHAAMVREALERNDLSLALMRADRWMLRRAAAGPIPELPLAEDSRRLVDEMRRGHDALQRARGLLAAVDAKRGDYAQAVAAVAQATNNLEQLTGRVEDTYLGLRLLGRTPEPYDLNSELGSDEALLVPVPLGESLHLFWVQGSTTTLGHAVSPRSVAWTKKALRAAWSGDAGPISELRAAFFEPWSPPATVIVSMGLWDVPLPQTVAPESVALAQLSAPSWLGPLRVWLAAGVTQRLRVVSASEAPDTVSVAQLRQLRKKKPSTDTVVLDQRSAAQRFQGQLLDEVLIEAPLILEPSVPERSVIAGPGGLDDPQATLAVVGLDYQARLLVVAHAMEQDLAGSALAPAFWTRLDRLLALKGYPTALVIPATLSEVHRAALLAHFDRERTRQGPTRALAEAIRTLAPNAPAVAQAILVGSPGMDSEAAKVWAADELKRLDARGKAALKKQDFRTFAELGERQVYLARETNQETLLLQLYGNLAVVWGARVSPPEPVRAVDWQEALVALLEKKQPPDPRAIARARLGLATLAGQAKDFAKAELSFNLARDTLERLDDTEGVAIALFEHGRHKRDNALEFEAAAELLERSVALWDRVGAYQRPADKRPPEADRTLVQLGNLYLNRLSDPLRAERTYDRAMAVASPAAQVGLSIDLIRAARRAGNFAGAARRATESERIARERQQPERELEAVIEAANVAWYQGEYRAGDALCARSLELARKLAAPQTGPANQERERRRRVSRSQIFARSVCGLLAMSQRRYDDALEQLTRARGAAIRLGDSTEVANQLNNLGRVYLEFGRFDSALSSFEAALSIDQERQDRYAMAYDFRNIGDAWMQQGELARAATALEKGLSYAREAKDLNNQLRATFGLAEVARRQNQAAQAKERYLQALPLAEKLVVKEISWQVHRALGLMAREAGDWDTAERELREAVQVVRGLSGAAGHAEGGLDRFTALDDLLDLLLVRQRPQEAFEVAELARRLELGTVLEDTRIPVSSSRVPGLLQTLRESNTASVSVASWQALSNLAPRVASMVRPSTLLEVQRALPPDGAVVSYRLLESALVIFVVTPQKLEVKRVEVSERTLLNTVSDYTRQMAARAELSATHQQLTAWLVEPILPLLADRGRLALIPHQGLRYVAFAALPVGEAQLIDRWLLVQAFDPLAGARNLAAPGEPITGGVVALGASIPAPGAADPPLPFAKRELTVIAEEYPDTVRVEGAQVTRAELLNRWQSSRVFHFAGHTFHGIPGLRDPLAARLRVADGSVSVLDLFQVKGSARLAVLSACFGLLGPDRPASLAGGGDELLSLALTLQLSGADQVIASSLHVEDVASALVMKHFYRGARGVPPSSALRAAQLKVRESYPHPAWWATFILVAGPAL